MRKAYIRQSPKFADSRVAIQKFVLIDLGKSIAVSKLKKHGLYVSDMKAMKAVMAFEDLISVWIQAVANEVSAVTCVSYKS